jgi:hypothetical protein
MNAVTLLHCTGDTILQQKVLGELTAYFPFIWHGLHRKQNKKEKLGEGIHTHHRQSYLLSLRDMTRTAYKMKKLAGDRQQGDLITHITKFITGSITTVHV